MLCKQNNNGENTDQISKSKELEDLAYREIEDVLH